MAARRRWGRQGRDAAGDRSDGRNDRGADGGVRAGVVPAGHHQAALPAVCAHDRHLGGAVDVHSLTLSPALCTILLQSKSGEPAWGFRKFDQGFGWLADRYFQSVPTISLGAELRAFSVGTMLPMLSQVTTVDDIALHG